MDNPDVLAWIILAERTRLICAGILGGIGAFALSIGLNDIAGIDSFSARLLALFFLMVGGFVLVSAIGLVSRTSWGPSSALVGSILGAIIGLILIMVQVVGSQNDYHELLWLMIVLASLWCARRLLKAGVDTAILKRIPALLAAVGIAGLLPFWYTELYVPSAPEPTLAMTIELTREGNAIIDTAKGTRSLAVKATITLKNGNSRLRYISLLDTAVGRKMSPKPTGRSTQELRNYLTKEGTTLSYADHGERKLLAAHSVFHRGAWLGPGEEITRTLVFYVPEGAFNIVYFSTQLWTGNGYRFNLGGPCHDKPYPTSATTVETKAREIEESSSLAKLTRNRRCIYSTLAKDKEGDLSSLTLGVAIDKAKFPPPKFTTPALEKVYGVFSTDASAELSLGDEEDSNKVAGKERPRKG
jgi:hypothetical protein